ncbi:MAG: hypothetical protein K0Q60_3278, partial [Microvirga sp.]|nr:hypothetical protein [Microvirga sp.]
LEELRNTPAVRVRTPTEQLTHSKRRQEWRTT